MKIRALPRRSAGQVEGRYSEGIQSLFSDGSADFVQPPGPHVPGDEVTLKLRGIRGAGLLGVWLRIIPDGEERLIKMTSEEVGAFTYWQAPVKVTRLPFPYRFRVQTERAVWWLNASGLHPCVPPDEEDFRLVPGFQGPEWPKSAFFYQIFPDRFSCGRPETALAPRAVSPSYSPVNLKGWHEPLSGKNEGTDFFGGDVWGILEKLDYLQELGVSALYLNPVFSAPSNHRYDVTDFRQVDPFLGGNEALIELSAELRRRGMQYILDGVFNHVGCHHPWFQEACQDAESPAAAFFSFSRHPRQYVSWMGHSSLPKLNYASRELRKEMWGSRNAVAKFWLKEPFGAAGWRLDAPNMLGKNGLDEGNLECWQEFRQAVKKDFPESYLFGECFFEGTKWLQGDAFDGIMNYKGFTIPLLQWVSGRDLHMNPGEMSARVAAQQMTAVMARIPFALRNLQYNSLSTHDIPRFIHRVDGNESLFRLALHILTAFPGVPSLYYGEELAMDGGGDPGNRRPMEWHQAEARVGLRRLIARLAGLRKSMRVLAEGAFSFLAAEEDALAFVRFLGDEMLIVAANRAPVPRKLRIPMEILGLEENQAFRSVLTMDSLKVVKNGSLQLSLGPREALWLVPA
jgi:alpha-glucosidase